MTEAKLKAWAQRWRDSAAGSTEISFMLEQPNPPMELELYRVAAAVLALIARAEAAEAKLSEAERERDFFDAERRRVANREEELLAKLAEAEDDAVDPATVRVEHTIRSVHESCRAKLAEAERERDELLAPSEHEMWSKWRAAEADARALREAIRVALGTMQKPMEAMGWFCRNNFAHNHDHVRALRAAMKVLQDAHDAAFAAGREGP